MSRTGRCFPNDGVMDAFPHLGICVIGLAALVCGVGRRICTAVVRGSRVAAASRAARAAEEGRRAGEGYGEEEGIGRESNDLHFFGLSSIPQRSSHVRRVPTATSSVPRGLIFTGPCCLNTLKKEANYTRADVIRWLYSMTCPQGRTSQMVTVNTLRLLTLTHTSHNP